jgi:glycine/D-amino acid oxidase-like deaminating enzyme
LMTMKKQTDILVIGGGAIGVCCAHYLTQSGRQVSLGNVRDALIF